MRSGISSYFLHGSTPIFAPGTTAHTRRTAPATREYSAKNSAGQTQVATFKEFHAYYEKVFGEPLPDYWYDERNVCLHRRVLDARVGKLLLKEEGGKVELVDGAGEVVFAVNSLAAQAISFIADTGAFYVRELPGISTTTRRSRSSLRWSSTSCFAWRLERANLPFNLIVMCLSFGWRRAAIRESARRGEEDKRWPDRNARLGTPAAVRIACMRLG